MLPIYIEAEYESGFVLREDEQDLSPYDRERNIFHAILHKRAEEVHGPLVRFSLVTPKRTWNYEWLDVPDNARPIRVMQMKRVFDMDGNPREDPQRMGYEFGAQWTETWVDEKGIERERNVKDTMFLDANGDPVEEEAQ